MDEFGLVWLSLVWFDEVDCIKCSRSACQLSFTNLLHFPLRVQFVSSVGLAEQAPGLDKICTANNALSETGLPAVSFMLTG